MLDAKMDKVIFARKFVEYTGIGFFLIHMVRNRFRVSRATGFYIVIPPVLSYLVKVFGYMWVDNYAYSSGMYKIYRISTL